MVNRFTARELSELLDHYAAALELFAAQWTDQPEDCVQEAILQLVRQNERPRNIGAWLFHVVKCRALSAHRAATRRRRHEGLAARLVHVVTHRDEPAFDASELAAALDHLDEQFREIVIARIWGGLGFAELGELLGISAATAYRRFETGLRNLRIVLEQSCQKINPPTPTTGHPNCPAT